MTGFIGYYDGHSVSLDVPYATYYLLLSLLVLTVLGNVLGTNPKPFCCTAELVHPKTIVPVISGVHQDFKWIIDEEHDVSETPVYGVRKNGRFHRIRLLDGFPPNFHYSQPSSESRLQQRLKRSSRGLVTSLRKGNPGSRKALHGRHF